MKYDNLLKTIFFDAMPALLRLMKCAPVVEYLSVEFPPRTSLIADVVALLEDGKILHIEFQVKNDPEMLWRCYHYYGAISQRWRNSEVLQFVVYLGSAPLAMESVIDEPSCKYHYEIVNMQEVPAQVFLDSPRDAERMLAIVSKSEDPRATIRQVLESWKGLSENELQENIERLRTLSCLRKQEIIAMEEVERMPFEIDIRESEIFQMGEKEGYNEAFKEALTVLLTERFGPLSPAIVEQIKPAARPNLTGGFDSPSVLAASPKSFPNEVGSRESSGQP